MGRGESKIHEEGVCGVGLRLGDVRKPLVAEVGEEVLRVDRVVALGVACIISSSLEKKKRKKRGKENERGNLLGWRKINASESPSALYSPSHPFSCSLIFFFFVSLLLHSFLFDRYSSVLFQRVSG